MTDNEKNTIIVLRGRGISYGEIASRLDISVNTIKSFCRRCAGKETASGSSCEQCGSPVVQAEGRKHKRFCCDKCRNAWWNSHLDQVKRKAYHRISCICCHREFEVYGNRAVSGRKYCSRECYFQERFGGKS